MVVLTEGGFLGVAIRVGDGTVAEAGGCGLGVLDFLSILDVESLDLLEIARVSSVGGQELGDDGEGFAGVNSELGTRTEEVFISHSVGVEVTAVLVTDSLEPFS